MKNKVIAKGNFLVILLSVFLFLFPHRGYAFRDRELYSRAIKSARSGSIDFAFLDLRELLNRYPESKFSQKALFSIGEYYFSLADYYDAAESFGRFVNEYPQSSARPFALAYLLKIAVIEENVKLIRELELKIITSQQLSFLFRDFKEYEYLSPFFKKYKALYFIDRVEFYIDDELFTKVFY